MKLSVLVCLSLVIAAVAAAAGGGLPDPCGYPWPP